MRVRGAMAMRLARAMSPIWTRSNKLGMKKPFRIMDKKHGPGASRPQDTLGAERNALAQPPCAVG